MQKLTSLLVISTLMTLGAGCGDDDDGSQAAVGPGPALTPEQCPAAPADVMLDELAPVWGGLVVLSATVPSGTADGFDHEIYDPTLGGWTRIYSSYWQSADGRYAFPITPNVTEQNKDSEFRIRVRSRLSGCAPSAWSEGPSFTLGDPLTDTSWKATWDAGAISGEINVNRFDDMQIGLPPVTPDFDGPLTHTVTFGADGVFSETYGFAFTSADGDPFEGCSFTLSYSGSWQFLYQRGAVAVLISDRVPVENAADGSSCDMPALSALAINDAMLLPNLAVPSTVISSAADYSGLLSDPAGPVRMESYQLASALQNPAFLAALSYDTASETGDVSGYLGAQYYVYDKQ